MPLRNSHDPSDCRSVGCLACVAAHVTRVNWLLERLLLSKRPRISLARDRAAAMTESKATQLEALGKMTVVVADTGGERALCRRDVLLISEADGAGFRCRVHREVQAHGCHHEPVAPAQGCRGPAAWDAAVFTIICS